MEFLNLFSDDVFRLFLYACHGIAIFVWILTLVTQNFSQMDRLWPILPAVYSWGFLFTSIYYNPNYNGEIEVNTSIQKGDTHGIARLVLMAFLISAWGVRLAYTFWRRGYYKSDHEDHRWDHVKKQFNYPEKN